MPEPTKKGRTFDGVDGISILPLTIKSKHAEATQKIQNKTAALHFLISFIAENA